MTIRCFWLEETGRATVALRRYAWAPDPHFQHEASTPLELDLPMEWDPQGMPILSADHAIANDDPRWPTTCTRDGTCSRAFAPSDGRQISVLAIYRRSDTGELVNLEAGTPAGAMWRERWYEPWADATAQGSDLQWRRGPDGICLAVRTPGGDWSIDRASAQGGFWDRSGTPPLVTANPSILMPNYHGWLRNGELVDA